MKKKQLDISLELQQLKNQFTTLEKILNLDYLDDDDIEIITVITPQNIKNNIKINNFYKELHNKDMKIEIENLSNDKKKENLLLLTSNRIIIYNLLINIKSNISIINLKLLDKPCSFFNLYRRYKKYRKKIELNIKKKIEIEKEEYLNTLLNGIEENLYFYN